MPLPMKFYPFKMNSVYLSSKINVPDVELQYTVPTAIANSIVLKTSLTIRLFKLKNLCSDVKLFKFSQTVSNCFPVNVEFLSNSLVKVKI